MPDKLDRSGEPLDHLVEFQRHSDKKKKYIYDVGEALRCTHPQLIEMSHGGSHYRCTKCNYALIITSSKLVPIHWLAIEAALNLFHISKEWGSSALAQMLTTPIGQDDGTPQKPVLPEGMSFMDVAHVLDEIDVNAEDNGATQLRKLLAEVWENPERYAAALSEVNSDSPSMSALPEQPDRDTPDWST